MIGDATLLKALKPGGRPAHGGRGVWEARIARSVHGKLDPCVRGLHYCRGPQILEWLAEELWLFEDLSPEETVDASDKLLTRRGRIVERVETWNETSARLFGADCAERVLPIYEQSYPGDDRPRRAVEASRLFAAGQIGEQELDAAMSAAMSAGGDAAKDAWAVYSGVTCAAWAAGKTAWATAGDAAKDAAWAAARDASWNGSRSRSRRLLRRQGRILERSRSAYAAAHVDERNWQWQRFKQYLNEETP